MNDLSCSTAKIVWSMPVNKLKVSVDLSKSPQRTRHTLRRVAVHDRDQSKARTCKTADAVTARQLELARAFEGTNEPRERDRHGL